MKEVKFRGWDKELDFMISIKRYKIDFNGQVLFDNNDKELYNQTNKIELMQYTGLKDKNGVEIYESDIIKAIWSKDCDEYIANEEWIGDIFFNYGSFDINGEWCVALNCFNGTLEVIGNIYENPELLN